MNCSENSTSDGFCKSSSCWNIGKIQVEAFGRNGGGLVLDFQARRDVANWGRIDWDALPKVVNMRLIGSSQRGNKEYQAIWATLSWINGDMDAANSKKALVVREIAGENIALINRNAKYAEVKESIAQLRSTGLEGAQLHQLFNYKGNGDGLCRHVKMLVSSLR